MEGVELDTYLSSLGMLSEPFFGHGSVSEEEREVLSNKGKLASIAAEKKKERAKKEQLDAIDKLQKRRVEAESIQKIYTSSRTDIAGNKVCLSRR